jgi:queuine tRNA-ribosyltransferase
VPIAFELIARCRTNRARLGRVRTPHGEIDTPAFMPVATAAAMKGMTPAQVRGTGTQIILNNAFHLMLRPGVEDLRRLGGSHRFMRWEGPMLTDSGGFQAWSMSEINSIDEEGVTFRSFIDGSRVRLTPERSMEVQNAIGADIIMAFDDCPPARAPVVRDPNAPPGVRARPCGDGGEEGHRRRLLEAHERTARWLERCWLAHARPSEQALFGIVQGGTDEALRRASVEAVCSIDLAGYAIGGVAVGESPQEIRAVVEFTAPLLPENRPRYLMGVGYERDIVMAVATGVDLFDCVLPTRSGRNALAFTRKGPVRLRNACHREDPRPLDPDCDCEACAGGFSRAYLRHLFHAEEMLGPTLTSIHNVRHFQRLMLDIRQAIREDRWASIELAWPTLRRTGEPPFESA